MGILRKTKKVVTAPAKAVAKGAKAVGGVLDPAKQAARVIDKTADTFKDDEFLVNGESGIEVFGVMVGRIYHSLRIRIADLKE